MKPKCPECGRKYINDEFLQKHLQQDHAEQGTGLKRKGWATPRGFVDFMEPVTYEDACEAMEAFARQMFTPVKPKKGNDDDSINLDPIL